MLEYSGGAKPHSHLSIKFGGLQEQSASQPISKPANPSTNWSANLPTKISQPISNPLAYQPISQPTNEPITWPLSQPTNQHLNQQSGSSIRMGQASVHVFRVGCCNFCQPGSWNWESKRHEQIGNVCTQRSVRFSRLCNAYELQAVCCGESPAIESLQTVADMDCLVRSGAAPKRLQVGWERPEQRLHNAARCTHAVNAASISAQ